MKSIYFQIFLIFSFFIIPIKSNAKYFHCIDSSGVKEFTDNIDECAEPLELDYQKVPEKDKEENLTSDDTEVEPIGFYHILSTFRKIKTIDGVLGKEEWGSVEPYVAQFKLPLGGTEDMYLYVMHDNDHLYLAVKFRMPVYVSRQSMGISFNQYSFDSGKSYEGQDFMFMSPDTRGSNYYDGVRTLKAPCPRYKNGRRNKSLCAFQDTKAGGKDNGLGVYRLHKNIAVYEFMKPLRSKDIDHDINLNPGDIFGLSASFTLLIDGARPDRYSGDIYLPGPYSFNYLLVKLPEAK